MLTIFITVITAAFSSMADSSTEGLFVEPAITYQRSEFDVSYPFASSSGETDGFGVGARLGFHVNDMFFVGVDGRYSRLQFEDTNSVFNYDTDADAFDIGPVVGVQMPDIGLRVWGTYLLSSTIDPKESSSLDLKFSSGEGFRIGAGFRVYMVSLNLEYQKVKFDKLDIQQIGPITNQDTSGVTLDNETWIASVSFPISFND